LRRFCGFLPLEIAKEVLVHQGRIGSFVLVISEFKTVIANTNDMEISYDTTDDDDNETINIPGKHDPNQEESKDFKEIGKKFKRKVKKNDNVVSSPYSATNSLSNQHLTKDNDLLMVVKIDTKKFKVITIVNNGKQRKKNW
jgi:hypothetical protein